MERLYVMFPDGVPEPAYISEPLFSVPSELIVSFPFGLNTVPSTVTIAPGAIVVPALEEAIPRSLKTVRYGAVIVCGVLPLKITIPDPWSKVPLFIQLPPAYRVPSPSR